MKLLSAVPALPVLLALFPGAVSGEWNSYSPPPNLAPVPLQTPVPDPGITPAPAPEPVPEPASTQTPPVVNQIFKVVFSAETLAEALGNVLQDTAEQTADEIEAQTDEMNSLLAWILKAPIGGYFAEISGGTLTTAAALAPALYLVRLALYHWNRMVGEEDTLLRVFGDWLAAGFLAVAAGPFLDAVVQTGWWMANAAIGEVSDLAEQFIAATKISNYTPGTAEIAGLWILIWFILIAGWLGWLLGVLGLAAAIASSQAVLFVLAVIAPVVAVLAVIPQMRWMRMIWLKAVAVLALVPVAAGGVFKAWASLSAYINGNSLAEILIRLIWLWGAVGFLLSLAGILGRMTISSAVDATVRIGRGIKSLRSNPARSDRGSPDSKEDGKTPSKASSQAHDQTTGLSLGRFETGLEVPQYLRSQPPGEEAAHRRISPFTAAFSRAADDIKTGRNESPAPHYSSGHPRSDKFEETDSHERPPIVLPSAGQPEKSGEDSASPGEAAS